MRPRKYNPGFLADADLISTFHARHTELATLLDIVRENTGAANQHVLTIAPRGYGKSTLVRRVAAEVRRDPVLSQRWFPIVFAEESYEVRTVGEFWLEALLHLSDAVPEPRWGEVYRELRAERDERRLKVRALAALLDFAQERGVRLLLVVENLDQLLSDDQINTQDAWKLRETLSNEPRIMLMGTAVRRFEGIEEPNQAMFDLFRRIELEPLNVRECDRIWGGVTGERLGLRRAKAVRILCGGNPRLVVILASFSEGRPLGELLEDLDGLIDDHTDYFRHNIEALSPQLRRVFLALAAIWKPAGARQVAEAARMEVNLTSALLKRLADQGRISVVRVQGKTHLYQVSERLYNIYSLMRRRGAAEARVTALVDFMRHLFAPEERAGDVLVLPTPAAAEAVAGLPQRPTIDSFLRHHPAEAPSALIRLAAAGQTREALDLLDTDAARLHLEPMIVALRLRLGEIVDAPIEVVEVAEEVNKRIDALVTHGDIWRTDPMALVLPDEVEED